MSLCPSLGPWAFELVITAEVQIHGYRKGHQLFASSVILSKEDQAVVDRLSDVAGPLRPKEQFEPYLSAYPLPSGIYYVIARTWQDPTVPRAGCVRTKSILVDADLWSRKPPLIAILSLLSSPELPNDLDAVSVNLEEQLESRLPPALDFSAGELLEALFLEDVKPVVVFDAPHPELIALRLLSALWPNIRRRFALTTFALSPRKIGGRDLDLVFAPSNTKAKFSDWPGRRVDGRLSLNDRHKWTKAIVRRVFEEPVPKLLSEREIELLDNQNAGSPTALRIALLWEELLNKLDQTPTAALGLLDIANSGIVNTAVAMKSLEPMMAEATRKVADTLSPSDAWDYVGAIVRKMQGLVMPACRIAIAQLVTDLSERAPHGAISLLQQPDAHGAIYDLIPNIAKGLGNGAPSKIEQLLIQAPIEILARLISQGGDLTRRAAEDDSLIGRIGTVLADVDEDLAKRVSMMVLPFLVEDRQLSAAVPIFDRLGAQEIIAEMSWLGEVNDFHAELLCAALIDRAREVNEQAAVRDVLVARAHSERSITLLARTIDPIAADVHWLLKETRLSDKTSVSLLEGVLRRADERQFAALFGDPVIAQLIVNSLPSDSLDILVRVLQQDGIPINTYLRLIRSLLPQFEAAGKVGIAETVLVRCLRKRFDGDEIADLCILLGMLGDRLDGSLAVRAGLERGIGSDVASRNLIVFDNAPTAARKCILSVVDEIAYSLKGRNGFDLDEAANAACARLMLDAKKTSYKALIKAAGALMPSLLRARSQPVSLIIAALFPAIYRELAKAGDVPDFLKFVPFVDWDRCRRVRHELVDAFISSSWSAGDLALTALLCGDLEMILELVARTYNGEQYILRIEDDLDRLSESDRRVVKRKISKIRSDRFSKPKW